MRGLVLNVLFDETIDFLGKYWTVIQGITTRCILPGSIVLWIPQLKLHIKPNSAKTFCALKIYVLQFT